MKNKEQKKCEHPTGYCKDGYDICGHCGAKVGGSGIPNANIIGDKLPSPTKPDKKPVDMGMNGSCTKCEKRLCTCPERNGDKSWTKPDKKEGVTKFNYADVIPELKSKPDTEEWEKEFDKEFSCKCGGDYCGNVVREDCIDDLKSFIRQEKEKSYNEGREQGMVDHMVTCEEYERGKRETRNDWFDIAEKEREKSYKEGVESENKRLLNQKANNHDQEVRHSVYSEIIEIIEQIKEPHDGISEYFSGWNHSLLKLKSKLTQK